MNLTERAETRREIFYKLTNSDVPETPSGNRNLLKSTKTFKGSNIGGSSTILNETYQGCAVRYFKNTNSSSTYQNVAFFIDEVYPNLGGEYVLSFWVKGSGTITACFNGASGYLRCAAAVSSQGASNSNPDGSMLFNLTDAWQRVWVKYKLASSPADATQISKRVTFLHVSNSTEDEIYLAGVQLEEGNVASSYAPAPEDLGWSATTLVPTQQQRYLWKFEYIYYSDGSIEVTQPVNLSIAGADADTSGVTDAINKNNQAVAEAKQQLTAVANDLSKAKVDLQTQASQLIAQAGAQSELTKRVSSVEKTANGTKTTVSELSKIVDGNTKNISSVTARTKTVEDDLSGTKTTLSQVKTTADSTSLKTATLETGLNGLSAKFDNLSVGAVNLLKNSKIFKGTGITGAGRILDETYQGCAVRHYAGANYCDIAQFSNCVVPKIGSTYVASFWAKGSGKVRTYFYGESNYLGVLSGTTNQNASTTAGDGSIDFTLTSKWDRYWVVYKLKSSYPTNNTSVPKHFLFRHLSSGVDADEVYIAGVKLEEGNIATNYSPNEADLELKVADYKQTADQNYASLQTTVQNLDGTVQQNKTTAEQTAAGFKTRIESLETYKSGESTRANQYFESAKTETARQLTAERTAIAKDYVAKSTYISDVTGIRNDLTATTTTANTTKTNLANYQASNDKAVANLQSNLQTANGNISSLQTKIEAVPGQITSAVSAVEGKIPTSVGGRNYLRGTSDEYKTYTGTNYILGYPSTYRDWNKLLDPLRGKTVTIRAYIKNDTNYPVRIQMWFTGGGVYGNTVAPHSEGWSVKTSKVSADWTSANVAFVQTDGTATGGTIQAKEAKLEIGNIPSDWSPAPEDYDSKLASAQSEIKQTTDAITASVSSVQTAASNAQSTANTAVSKADAAQTGVNTLDSTTVKSASLTINTDGIVMKAGKSTTDVANAIGSYFAVNQNAINLFADKIKVKGDMIVDGAITSTKIAAGAITADKIAANSINSSNIVSSGITANVIKGGVLQSLSNATNFELDTGKLFYNSNNTGVFRVEDGASTMGLKFSNTPITVNGTSRILSRVILGGDRRETSLDDGKWDQGGFTGIVAETINGVNSNQNEHADTLRVIGDNIYFTHSYDYDSSTGISAQGWKMETFSPFSSYPGNVVLKPYGVNYRQSDIITGDIRLDNGDGSGYWVRDCIRTLKRCFQHYLNGGTTSGAMNAIRDTLKDISGV